MRAWRYVCCVMASALALMVGACGGGGSSEPRTGPSQVVSVTLRGRVLDATTDSGVANATVTIAPVSKGRDSSRQGRTTTTNPEGSYSLSEVPPGKASMSIELPNGAYQSIVLDIDVPTDRPTASVTARLVPRDTDRPTSVTLSPKAQSVAVGSTLQFAAQIAGPSGLKAFFLVQGDAGNITADGLFTAVKPGTATVVAQVGDVSDTTSVTVTPSTKTTGVITGMVTDTAGLPVAGAAVASDRGASATTGVDGQYTLPDLTAGNHNLTASKSGFYSTLQTASLVGGQTLTMDWRLAPVQSATGTVVVE